MRIAYLVLLEQSSIRFETTHFRFFEQCAPPIKARTTSVVDDNKMLETRVAIRDAVPDPKKRMLNFFSFKFDFVRPWVINSGSRALWTYGA